MRSTLLFRLLDPVSGAVARQLSRPSGWFGRVVMTRVLNRGNRALIQATLDGVPLHAGSRLLDVGFGGGLLLDLARRRGVGALAGVDPSEAAVAALLARRRSFDGCALEAKVGLVEALPFEDASFDVVASTNTVYFWPDPARAFRELARVLRPGGRLTLGYSGAEKLRGFRAITRHGFLFHEDGALVAAAAEAGLRDVSVTALSVGVTEGDRVLRGTAPAGRPAPG